MSLLKRNEASWLPFVLDDMFKTDGSGGSTNRNAIGNRLPAVNIKEQEDIFMIDVAAPGKKREDFKIQLDNDILTISSEEKNQRENDAEVNFTRREFSYSNFSRAFIIPETVNSEKIGASYEDGVLKISLPKKEEAKVQPKRMIQIS